MHVSREVETVALKLSRKHPAGFIPGTSTSNVPRDDYAGGDSSCPDLNDCRLLPVDGMGILGMCKNR